MNTTRSCFAVQKRTFLKSIRNGVNVFLIDLRIARRALDRSNAVAIASPYDMDAIERRVISVKIIVLGFINRVVWWSSRRHIRLFRNVGGIKFISTRTVMILAWESAYNSDPTVPNGNQ